MRDNITPGLDLQGKVMNPHTVQEHFEVLFEDVFGELTKFGEIKNLNTCDNLSDHMVKNFYVQFREEVQAAAIWRPCKIGFITSGRLLFIFPYYGFPWSYT